jgi:hypothetical protein
MHTLAIRSTSNWQTQHAAIACIRLRGQEILDQRVTVAILRSSSSTTDGQSYDGVEDAL